MAHRSDFTQKLLNDLRLRKERLGILSPERRSQPMSPETNTGGYENTRVCGRQAMASNSLSFRNRGPSLKENSEKLILYQRDRSREQGACLSMASALSFCNRGKFQHIKIHGSYIMGKKISLHADGNHKIQILNMILEPCSNGISFDRDSLDVVREFLEATMDLKDSLRMLREVSPRKQQLELLKEEEINDDDDEGQIRRKNQQRTESRMKFCIIRDYQGYEVLAGNKKAVSEDENSRNPLTNSSRYLSKFCNCMDINSSSELMPESPAEKSHGNHRSVVSDKVGIPNVIAKLMGLEDHLRFRNKLREADKDINKKEISMADISAKGMLKNDAQEKILLKIELNNVPNNSLKESKNTNNLRNLGSKDVLNAYVRNNGQMIVKKIENKSENMVKKGGMIQEKKITTKGQIRGRKEMTEKAQSSTENVSSNKMFLTRKTSSQLPKRDKNINHNGKESMKKKITQNHHNKKQQIEHMENRSSLKINTTAEKIVRTSIQSEHKANIIKVREEEKQRCSHDETLQNKDLDSSLIKKQRSSILEELERRWNQRKNQSDKRIKKSTEIDGTKTAPCSKPLAKDQNFQVLDDQPMQNVESVNKCSQEEKTEQNQGMQSGSTDNKEDDNSLMQAESSKSEVHKEQKSIEACQQVLTKDEDRLKQILATSEKFRNMAEELFQITIPVSTLQAAKNESSDENSRLIIDCGYEMLTRKSIREELISFEKGYFQPSKTSIEVLIKELHADFKCLKYQNYTKRCGNDLAKCLENMIEDDIQQWHPHISCLWNFGWDKNTKYFCSERSSIVRDMEKNVVNGLINELVRDLLNVNESKL